MFTSTQLLTWKQQTRQIYKAFMGLVQARSLKNIGLLVAKLFNFQTVRIKTRCNCSIFRINFCMATLNEKLYAIGGDGTTSIEFLDANNPAAGWQLYSQASFPVERRASSCLTIRTNGTWSSQGSGGFHIQGVSMMLITIPVMILRNNRSIDQK